MMAGSEYKSIPLIEVKDNKKKEEEYEVKPYLTKYVKSIKEQEDIIKWDETKEDYDEYKNVLKHYNMDKLKRMLLGGAPYLYKVNDSKYPITHAAFYSRTDIMEIILERHKNEGRPDDKKTFSLQTSEALKTVCKNNCGDIARVLLQVDTPVLPNIHLKYAAENGSTAVLDEILTFIPDLAINTMDDDGNTPLHKAVEGKQQHTVQYLLNHNANPNLANHLGYNSVHMACQYADDNIVYLLTTRGGDVNARDHKGKTPALIAAENGKDGCIHILAAAGANLDQRDTQGNVPLIVAASQGHTNTVKELIHNGASFDVTDNERYNALERAILNQKDGTAAMIIRLRPEDDFVKTYIDTIEISLFKIVGYRLTETLKALLDKMVVQNDPLDSTNGVVRTEYLDLDTDKITPGHVKYQKNKTFFLQSIASLDDEEIAYHGTIRLLVDDKMKKFGYGILSIRIFFNVLFLLSLAYSFIIAAYEPIKLDIYTKNEQNIIRIFTESFVLVYFCINILTEGVGFFRVATLTSRYLKDKKMDKEKEKTRDATVENGNQTDNEVNKKPIKRSITSRLSNIVFIHVVTDYFSDKSNYFDVLGLLTLFILIILRVTTQPTQWIFATATFLILSIRSFKLVALIPRIGPYTNIIYKILVNDVPLFSTLVFLTLLIFTGAYSVSLRAPYSGEGFINSSLYQDTKRINGIENEVQWVFLSGLRLLLEDNIYQGQYLFEQLNWLSGSLYLGFLFLTVVVYLNVFIAQLSDTYGRVRRNAERTSAWQRLNFIVQIERTSLMSLGLDYRKDYFIREIPIDKETLFKYYGVYNIKSLNLNAFRNDVNANSVLASIQSQQNRLEMSNQAILKMIEEKFNQLK